MDSHHLPCYSPGVITRSGAGIDHLPSELLILIFEVSANDVGGCDPHTVIAWSQVNRLWRRLSLSMPHLWANVHVHHQSSDVFALRSVPFPISITLIEPTSFWLPQVCQIAINRILRDAHRIQDLRISANPEVIDSISSAIRLTPLPLLSSLHLTSTWDAFIVLFQPGISAPNLRELYLDSATVDVETCANLTHLYIENNRSTFDADQLLMLLGRSPRLRMLSLRDMYLDEEDLVETDLSVELAHLERLHLQDFDQAFVDYFFAHLFVSAPSPLLEYRSWRHSTITFVPVPDLPHLSTENGTLEINYSSHSMRLHGGSWHHPLDITAIPLSPLIPLASTFTDLTEIHLLTLEAVGIGKATSVDVWDNLLSSMPSLTRINLNGPYRILKSFLLALWPDFDSDSPPRQNICLHLTHVHLYFDELGEDTEASGQFIVKRLEAGEHVGRPPLEMLEIRSAVILSRSIVDKLRSFVKLFTVVP